MSFWTYYLSSGHCHHGYAFPDIPGRVVSFITFSHHQNHFDLSKIQHRTVIIGVSSYVQPRILHNMSSETALKKIRKISGLSTVASLVIMNVGIFRIYLPIIGRTA